MRLFTCSCDARNNVTNMSDTDLSHSYGNSFQSMEGKALAWANFFSISTWLCPLPKSDGLVGHCCVLMVLSLPSARKRYPCRLGVFFFLFLGNLIMKHPLCIIQVSYLNLALTASPVRVPAVQSQSQRCCCSWIFSVVFCKAHIALTMCANAR